MYLGMGWLFDKGCNRGDEGVDRLEEAKRVKRGKLQAVTKLRRVECVRLECVKGLR